MSKLIVSACCAATVAFASAALAVDIENQDGSAYTIGIAIGDASPTTFTLKPGETKKDVCNGTACVLELDAKNWDGFTDEIVVIKDKKFVKWPRS